MAQTINTNLASLNAQRNLNKSQGALSTSLQRLSSGLRINSAKDDAAGLAISNRFTSQVRGLNQAIRNANDGISIAQTAEGAMSESTNILQRMRELSIQSANGSNSASERKALNSEVVQLKTELDRITNTTAFGGRKLLDGTFGVSSFQVGSAANETVSLSMANTSTSTLKGSLYTTAFTAPFTGTATAAGTATATVVTTAGSTVLNIAVDVGDTAAVANDKYIAAVNNANLGFSIQKDSAGANQVINTADSTGASFLTTITAGAAPAGLTAGTATTVGAASTSNAVSNVDISTASGAQSAILIIDGAIKTIDANRADLGAIQNRLDSTIANLSNISENVSAANSRITDADFAAETANMSKNQILQQAGISILSQANSLPQQVLSLLK